MDGAEQNPVAQVQTIRFEGLSNGNADERAHLYRACCDDGFFYLDMQGTAEDIDAAVQDIYTLETQLFAMPQEELIQYDIDKLSPKKLNGYKPLGRNHGELAGRKDGFESYALPKDGIMGLGILARFQRPTIIDLYMSSLRSFTSAVTTAAKAILSSLSGSLELGLDDGFCETHGSHLPSLDLVRLLRYHAQPHWEQGASHLPHTDLGSMAFLFTKQDGLQILGAKSAEWEWMPPKKGHAIVNIGDCLSLLTNKMFRSCRHRVKAAPGQAMKERYSFAYFMRPDENALMQAVSSRLVPKVDRQDQVFTSGEWLQKKYAMLRKDTWKDDENWVLTGAGELD
ncbi:MAG: hypothetical protein Q9211_005539 [Gyalolechia sp. 1 TL-2023]